MWLPLAMTGLLSWNILSVKELDEVASYERTRRPLGDFYAGLLLGFIAGSWLGISYGERLKAALDVIQRAVSIFMPSLTDGRRPPPPEGVAHPAAHPGVPSAYMQPPMQAYG
mmetsp:Transcript_28169/g.65097  ORF Transcript_28169/g.65097 Transcript_28169/m.65097 type:complete len:112 (+) Transcript_28169:88-423(+)